MIMLELASKHSFDMHDFVIFAIPFNFLFRSVFSNFYYTFYVNSFVWPFFTLCF